MPRRPPHVAAASLEGVITSTIAQPDTGSILRQPTAVWAIAFACAVSFMGIGLVDPILPAISHELGASPSQTMLLFTSYLFVTGIAMFFTSWVSSRIGVRWTLVAGSAPSRSASCCSACSSTR